MIDKIDNNCSFKANIVANIRVKDKARFKNIQELFKNATKQYPKETLYLSQGNKNKLSLHTANRTTCEYGEEICTDNLNNYLKVYSDAEIVKKFIDAFKVLRLTDISATLRKTIQYNKEKFISNKKIAKTLREAGRDVFAEKYDLFAQFNKEKIQNLNIQFNTLKNNFIKQQKLSSKQLPEVMDVSL